MNRIGQAIAGAAIIGVASLAAFWLVLPRMVESRVAGTLRDWGYPDAQVAIDGISLTGAVGGFSLGVGDQGADVIRLTFTLADLWNGRVAAVELSGVRLVVDPGLIWRTPPFETLRFSDGVLTVPLPMAGNAILRGAGSVGQDGVLHMRGRVDHAGALADADIGVTLDNGGWRRLSLRLSPLAGQGPQIRGTAELRRGPDGAVSGDGEIAASALKAPSPDMVLRWQDGQGEGQWHWPGAAHIDANLTADGAGRHRLSGEVMVQDIAAFAARLGLADPGLTGGPVKAVVSADSVDIAAFPGQWPDIALRIQGQGIGIAAGPKDNRLTLGLSMTRRDGDWWLAPLSGMDGALAVPTLGVAVQGLGLSGRVGLPLALDVTAAALRIDDVPPLSILARISGDPAADIQAEWTARGLDGALRLSGDVSLSPASGQGGASLRLDPLALSAWTPDLSGQVAARAKIRWDGQGRDGQADIMLDQVGIARGGLRLAGIDGVLRVDRLFPLTLSPQTLSVGWADLGLGLSDIQVGLALPGDGILRLSPMPARWGNVGVTLSAEPFRLGNETMALSVALDKVPAKDVLARVGVDDTSIGVSLIGSIPVQLSASGAMLGDGRLDATGPGNIQRVDPHPPRWLTPGRNDNLALVTRALADYRFDRMQVRFGPEITLVLDGSNPALFGGYGMPMNLILAPVPPVMPESTMPPPPAIAAAMASFRSRKD